MPSKKLTDLQAKARAAKVLSGSSLPDAEIERFARADAERFVSYIMNGQPHELRGFTRGKKDGTYSGVFSSAKALCDAAFNYAGEADWYVTANPVSLEPIDLRSVDKGECAGRDEILEIRWLLIDIDPHEADPDADLFAVVAQVDAYLQSLGFPELRVLGQSGRGYWLLWRIDQEATPENEQLRKRFLMALKERWVQVDTSVHTTARIVRLFGTMNLKVNKRSGLLAPTTDDVVFPIVPEGLIEAVAATAMESHPVTRKAHGVKADVAPILQALADRGITTGTEKEITAKGAKGYLFQLSDCPFYPDETHGDAAALIAWEDGNISFGCRGGRCQEHDNRLFALLDLLDLRPVMGEVAGRLKVIGADEIRTKHLQFAFDGRIAIFSLNLLMGDEKIGKGLFSVWLMTALSTGWLTGTPTTVLYVTVEERLTGVKARLIAAGADLSRVKFLEMGSLGIPSAIPQLGATMKDIGATWLFLDGINKHFDRGLSPTSAADVHAACSPLGQMADELEITVFGTIHTNRSQGLTARDKMAHQLEFLRAARSLLTIGTYDGDEDNERTVTHSAGNDVEPAPALKVRIDTVSVTDDDGEARDIGAVVIVGETDATTEDLFLNQADREGQVVRARAAKGQKISAKRDILSVWDKEGKPETLPASVFEQINETYGKSAMSRARKDAGITTEREQDPDTGLVGQWVWRFPAT